MKNSISLIITVFGLTTYFPAHSNDLDKVSDDIAVKATMRSLAQTLEEFMPLIFNEYEFNKKENESKIISSIETIDLLFKKAEAHFIEKPVTYQISSQVLEQQIEEARQSFIKNQKSYSRSKLLGMTAVCSSCHIQDKKNKHIFNQVDRKYFEDDYTYAEFLFLTRDYQQASQYYEKFLENLNAQSNEEKVYIAFERLIVIYAQLFKNPQRAYNKLNVWHQQAPLSEFVKHDLGQWLKGLKEYNEESGTVNGQINFEQLDNYMSKHINIAESQTVPLISNEKEKIFYMMLRSSLHDYLLNNPTSSKTPSVLYWLAICDRTLNSHNDFSFADWYLKSCIVDFPESKVAPKCYQAYEDHLKFMYKLNNTEDFPIEVRKELHYLKKNIDKN